MKRLACTTCFIVILATQSCTAGILGDSSAASTDTATPLPTVNATATGVKSEIKISPPKIAEGISGTIVLGTIRNDSVQYLDEILLEVDILDATGERLDQQLLSPILAHLAPTEESAYIAHFNDRYADASAETRIVYSENNTFERATLDFQSISTFTNPSGEHAILGTLTNPSDQPLSLHNFALLLLDDTSELYDLARLAAGPTVLAAEQTAPILVTHELHPIEGEWVLYADATYTSSLPPLS